MWILVHYDLPMVSTNEKRQYTKFRKKILKDGFTQFQFSMYIRHCSSKENTEVHIKRVKSFLPPKGHVGILTITDKQFGSMEIFRGKELAENPKAAQQLELF